jgi:hypothetical protein
MSRGRFFVWCVQVQRDAAMGSLAYFRVYSGNFVNKMNLLNTTSGDRERSTKLLQVCRVG